MENTTHEDYEEDDVPQSLLIRNGRDGLNRKEMLYLAGAGILLLVILALAFWPKGETEIPAMGSTTASETTGTAAVRLDIMDRRLTEIENRLNRAPESGDFAGRSIENSERIEQVLARLETIDKRLEEMQKTVQNRPAARAAEPVSKAQAQPQTAARQHYEVKKGDSPYSIARKHGMAIKDLLELNGMHSNSVIQPGDRIRIK